MMTKHDHDHGTGHDDEEHHHGEYNMHVWLSPEIARETAIAIHNKLTGTHAAKESTQLDANLYTF